MDSTTTTQRGESVVDQQSPAICSFALDEAFADLPKTSMRVDQPKAAKANQATAADADALVTQISTQLRAIEQQRARLVKLLNDYDAV